MNISFILFICSWSIVSLSLLFKESAFSESVMTISLLISLVLLTILLASAITRMFVKKVVIIEDLPNYTLIINTEKGLNNLKNKEEIRYTGNFLVATHNVMERFEIPNEEAFILLTITGLEAVSEPKATILIEESPEEIFDHLMGFLWVASPN